MKLLFICSSLEAGKDGVGDYTLRLAAELIRLGIPSAAIALKDRHVASIFPGLLVSDNVEVPVLRLPSALAVKHRLGYAKMYIDDFEPDWISFQFVIFGFHPRGLPFGLGSWLSFLVNERPVHIMFHEIWQGESAASSLKFRIWGMAQKKIIRNLVSKTKPRLITTSNGYYQNKLNKIGVAASLLPIFSNLPVGNKLGSSLMSKLPKHITNNRGKYIIGSFFGEVHYDISLSEAFDALQLLVRQTGRQLFLTHIGETDKAEKLWSQLNSLNKSNKFTFGRQDGRDIADYFCGIDIGLSTNPKLLFEKSGSIAAMLNNNLPVILVRDSFEADERDIVNVKPVHEVTNINNFINQEKNFGNEYSVYFVARKYVHLLTIS